MTYPTDDLVERIESLSPESKVSRFCKEAGFVNVVEVGQYFMTKDTGDFRQFRSVACREYTLPRDDPVFTTKRMDSRKYENWACIGSHEKFFNTSNMELKFESGP